MAKYMLTVVLLSFFCCFTTIHCQMTALGKTDAVCSFKDGQCNYHISLAHPQGKCANQMVKESEHDNMAAILANLTQKIDLMGAPLTLASSLQDVQSKYHGLVADNMKLKETVAELKKQNEALKTQSQTTELGLVTLRNMLSDLSKKWSLIQQELDQLNSSITGPTTQKTSVLRFSGDSTTSWAVLKPLSTRAMVEMTICATIRTQTNMFGGLLSHAVPGEDNYISFHGSSAGIFLEMSDSLFFVNGNTYVANLGDGKWHFICITWENREGDWQFLVDSTVKNHGSGILKGGYRKPDGVWVVGQEQDTVGGGFHIVDAFKGDIASIDVWDRVIDVPTEGCSQGNVIAWPGPSAIELHSVPVSQECVAVCTSRHRNCQN